MQGRGGRSSRTAGQRGCVGVLLRGSYRIGAAAEVKNAKLVGGPASCADHWQ